MFLEEMNSILDLKKLNEDDLPTLCEEIRKFLIDSISITGGHLASNLGVVELTVAMHYVYDSPKDKFIFDVGHQSYVHKILTGRRNEFVNLRKYKGLSGFPKAEESEHDAFDTGHSTTSISAALGYAVGRDLKQGKNKVIAVIGDGSFTGGMAYEALNNAGKSKSDMLVILNDNNMSISENVGELSTSLSKVRMSSTYNEVKINTKNALSKLFDDNSGIENIITSTKRKVRNVVNADGSFFEELGFKYYGKIDGNDINEMIKVLKVLKKMNRPVVLHIDTKKGLGYKYSEENPEVFHGAPKFDIKTGAITKSASISYSKCFGEKLVTLANEKTNIVAIVAAMSLGTGLTSFAETYPNRFFDVGICEQHAVTFASGLTKTGVVPFVAIYSTFLQRAYDQIIHDVAITNQHVVFCIDRAGLVGADGETHQGVFDIGYLINIPNMVIASPSNANELCEMIDIAYKTKSPFAIRYPRGNVSIHSYENKKVILGESNTIIKGGKIAIISVGTFVDRALEVAEKLKEEGINITVINPRFLKPIDINMVKDLEEYEHIFVLEDGQKINGFGSYLQLVANENNINIKVNSLGYEDRFTNQGSIDELQKEHKVDCENLVAMIKNL